MKIASYKAYLFSTITLCSATAYALTDAEQAEVQRVHEVLRSHTGCYLVDYSYTETKSLREGYERDTRVYDVNSDKTVYEWIYPVLKSPTELRLQRILFLRDLKTGEVKGLLKHHAEDWAYQPSHMYQYAGPGSWTAKTLPKTENHQAQWLRKITALDDGLRYQCAAPWNFETANPEWSCGDYAPIPGRETRDMGRRDYDTLYRNTRIISYSSSWVERQDNIKTQWNAGQPLDLAQEHGRIWSVRQPDSLCAEAREFARPRLHYWEVLMNTWEEVYNQAQDIHEQRAVDGLPRFVAMHEIERQYAEALAADPSLAQKVRLKILEVIQRYLK